jgi:hypothetical protein
MGGDLGVRGESFFETGADKYSIFSLLVFLLLASSRTKRIR